jgi:hypothetical protein
MKSLKYLHLNFKPCGYESDYERADLDSNNLIVEDRSLSNIETLIIGSKLFLLLYIMMSNSFQ